MDIEEGKKQGSTERKGKLKLYKAAMDGDWKKAEKIYKEYGFDYTVRITKIGETPLHIATAAGRTRFVRQLVKQMEKQKEDLAVKTIYKYKEEENGREVEKTKEENTAFFYAAISGNVDIARIMMTENSKLAMIRGRGEALPIYVAALAGHKKMVRYLYDNTPKYQLQHKDLRDLLVNLVKSDIYGEFMC